MDAEEKLRKVLQNIKFLKALAKLSLIIKTDFTEEEWDFVTGYVVGNIVQEFKPLDIQKKKD